MIITYFCTKQYVSINSSESEQNDIVCGVPQGSILGSLPFILYVNDITNTSHVLDFILFADDTIILYLHSNIENQIYLINDELNKVSNWFTHVKAKKLSVNASKTNYMILETPHMVSRLDGLDTNVNLDNTSLERVKYTKFLGILIDNCLSWKNPCFKSNFSKYWCHE